MRGREGRGLREERKEEKCQEKREQAAAEHPWRRGESSCMQRLRSAPYIALELETTH